MERIKRLLAIEPGPVRLAAPGLSALVAITLCATTLAAQQEPVQQAVRQLVELGGKALHVAGQEAQGTQAALERFAPETPVTTQTTVSSPSENLGAEPLPLMPHHRLTEATLPTQPMELPPAPIHPAGAEQDAQILPVERLGFVLPAFADTPVDPWPDEMATLEAKSLPSYDDGVACLRSPLASAQSTRLLKLRIPGHSKLRVTAQGLSGKPKDAEFTVDYIHHQSLRVGTLDRHARKRWPQQVHYERGNADVIINPSEFPQSVMVVVSGPMRTPYRLGRFLEPVTEAQDPQISLPGYPLEPWPVSNAVLSASAPVACEGPLPRPEVAFDLQTALYPSDVGTGHYTWQAPNAGPVTHLRCLSLEVQPGERLAFKPWGTSQVLMEVVTPRGDEDAAWIQAVEKANKSGKFARSRGIKVHNPTGMPQQLVLVLYRLEEMKDDYRVNLERSPAR